MATIVRNEAIDPRTLGSVEREALVSSLYAVHNEIFDGVSREEFAAYVVESRAEKTRIQLSYGDGGELAGYLAMHAFRPTLRGETCTVLRAEAGLRRAYRGNSSTAGFAFSNVLQARFEYSGPTFYLGCLVHPSSYTIFGNNAPTVWPAPGVEIPEDLFDLMMHLGEEFHLEMVDPARPLVRKVGWITRDTEAERRYWRTCDRPAARFYIEQNPGYTQGHGLLTLMPLDAATAAKTAVQLGTSRIKKQLHRTMGSLERSVLRRQLDAYTAEELLSTVEEITGLDLDAVRQAGLLGTRFPVSARQTLFRAGDPADAMYVVVEGSLFVLDDSQPGGEVVIDQLGPNTLIGEMAIMTGHPRTATVRAAIDSVLLRLTKEDLQKLLSAEPRLESALWQHIHGRMFALLLRQIPTHEELPREAKEEWFAAGSSHALAENQRLELPSESALVLTQGKLVVEAANEWMSLSAPALVKTSENSTVTATSTARFAVLPGKPPEPA